MVACDIGRAARDRGKASAVGQEGSRRASLETWRVSLAGIWIGPRPELNGWLAAGHASARAKAATTASISASVVPRPRLKRIAPIPISGATPIAASTGDSVTAPE